MHQASPSYLSENQSIGLRRLLEDVDAGHIQVPRFQRPFVWNDRQRLDLLNSIKASMPVGSLLVWRTSSFRLACFNRIGPYRTRSFPEGTTSAFSYLLDGHQRVSTLYGLLIPRKPTGAESADSIADFEDNETDWDIAYDLESERFIFRNRREARGKPLLPLWVLLDSRLLFPAMRRLGDDEQNNGTKADQLSVWEERASQLAYRFQEYKIPVIAMATDDLALATQTFQRINSLGTAMSEAHLVAALTWSQDFDLRERIEEMQRMLPVGWHDLGERTYLQVCKGLSDLDMTKAGQVELIKALKENPRLIDDAGRLLARAVALLVENAFVLCSKLLPYAMQLSLLAVELRHWEPGAEPKDALLRWFWRSSWSGAFASATYTQVRHEQTLLHSLACQRSVAPIRIELLPPTFDSRNARSRLLTLRFAARLADTATGRLPLEVAGRLTQEATEAMVRLIARPHKPTRDLARLLNGPCNRVLALNDSPLDDSLFASEEYRQNQLISDLAYQFEDNLSFLKQRQTDLQLWDLEEAQRMCGEVLHDD